MARLGDHNREDVVFRIFLGISLQQQDEYTPCEKADPLLAYYPLDSSTDRVKRTGVTEGTLPGVQMIGSSPSSSKGSS